MRPLQWEERSIEKWSWHSLSFFPLRYMTVCKQLIKCWETKQNFWLSPNSRVAGFGFFCSVTQSYTTICDPMDCNTLGFPALHHLPGFAQSHVHWVSDVIQWSCPLLSPSPPDFRVFSSVLVLRIRWPKYQAFSFSIHSSNEYQDSFPLGLTGLISLQSKGLSRVFSNTTVQKHQFFGSHLSLWSNSHICICFGF